MKNERSKSASPRPSLDQRFSDQPEVIDELHGLRDEVERALANGALAHEVEEMLQRRMRELGRRLLGGWAGDDQLRPTSQPPPGSSKHAKKTPVAKRLWPNRSHRTDLAAKRARTAFAAFLHAPRLASPWSFPAADPCSG
jgi:hypothetical protein